MALPQDRTFSGDFKRFFIRGLAVLLPSLLTLWLLVYAYQFINTAIAAPVNEGVRLALIKATPSVPILRQRFEPTDAAIEKAVQQRAAAATGLPPNREAIRVELRRNLVDEWWAARWYMNFIGLVIAIIGVYIAGRLVGGFLGRSLYRRLERVITRVPVLKQVYPSVKQVVDFFFSEDKQTRFSHVVILEYPRAGVWSMGFLTGEPLRAVAEKTGDTVTVFVPSSPTPFTGYTITVPRNEVLDVAVTVDEALRFLVSGGVLVPRQASQASGANQSDTHAALASPASLPPAPAPPTLPRSQASTRSPR